MFKKINYWRTISIISYNLELITNIILKNLQRKIWTTFRKNLSDSRRAETKAIHEIAHYAFVLKECPNEGQNKKWMNEWMNEWVNERMNEWMNEQTNEWRKLFRNLITLNSHPNNKIIK